MQQLNAEQLKLTAMNSKIKQWLNNPEKSFEDGLALYDQVKSDSKKDAFFHTAPTFPQGTIQFNILAGELTRLSRILDQKQPEIKAVVKEQPPIKVAKIDDRVIKKAQSLRIVGDAPQVKYDELPDEMKEKYDRIKELTKTLGGLFALVNDTQISDNDRKEAANELCNHYDKRKSLWVELDTWADNKNEKKEEPKALTAPEIKKEIKLRRDNINRALKNKEPKNKARNEKSIKKWTKEIEDLERKLDSIV